jgi:hypothetical protein
MIGIANKIMNFKYYFLEIVMPINNRGNHSMMSSTKSISTYSLVSNIRMRENFPPITGSSMDSARN